MSVHAFHRRPLTPLARACPAYRDALREYERALERGDTASESRLWEKLREIAEIFGQGADFARKEAAGGRR